MTSELVYTPVSELAPIRDHLNASFKAGKAKSIAFRKEQLLQLAYLFQDNIKPFQDALAKDLGRPVLESNMLDLSGIIGDALYAYKNIDSWVKPDKAPFDINWFPFSPKINKEPKGTVLIISPFNYPLWCMGPIAGAIAAGCAVVTKPSELTPATSQLITDLFPKYLDQDLYRVVNGAVEETTKLLSLKWDHILYTGSGRVGRIIALAAAKHLTPATLELGGKSPVIVDSNSDFDLTAKRLLWGKMINSGQTCTAPDYVIVPDSAQAKLVTALKVQYKKFYGDDPRTSGSFSRICATAHWDRINGLLAETKGNIVVGGEGIRAEKYIAPTIVQNVSFDDSLMTEELFGPILCIIPVPSIEIGLQYIRSHDSPLALYVFSKDSKFRKYGKYISLITSPPNILHNARSVRENTLSGMFFENDVVLQGGSSVTPFGGVGPSGYGAHKGKYSFDMFTHHRSSYSSPSWIDVIMGVRFPPYTDVTLKKVNSLVLPTIPYPRPGESAPFNWKRYVTFAVVFAAVAMNKQRITNFIKP
ncbi:NAD-aldehyde dehydrogenase [Hysterangium stoloniferum]|nr:NAD-aldehyde dehydrogenase [Hysterangium stoloniferum]